jgi:hypothetical protein
MRSAAIGSHGEGLDPAGVAGQLNVTPDREELALSLN